MTENSYEIKKIKIMASYDWSMRKTFLDFINYLDPEIKWNGKTHKIQLGRIIAGPLKLGENLKETADLIVDRTIHWNYYYKCLAQQGINSQMAIANHTNTFENHDKHSTFDLMARAIHPKDHFPTTVLLPQFSPYTHEQKMQEMWEIEQGLIMQNTKFGWDPNRKYVDWDKVHEKLEFIKSRLKVNELMRSQFYAQDNYLKNVVEKYFNNKFPLIFKKAFGGGGSDVYKVNSLEELYEKYDQTNGKVFHLQEAVVDEDVFIRCMAIGPQVLPMRFLPDTPLHEHYSPEKLKVNKEIFSRLKIYIDFINSYHRWTYNSFEALVKDGCINPIDFANACPDSNLTSLHVHFPWLITALVKWFTYIAVTGKDMRIDMEQNKCLTILNNPEISGDEKFEFIKNYGKDYFEVDKFNEYCETNFKNINERMIDFYDKHFDGIIQHAIELSDFPAQEHERFYCEYKDKMDNTFRKNADQYLKTVIYE